MMNNMVSRALGKQIKDWRKDDEINFILVAISPFDVSVWLHGVLVVLCFSGFSLPDFTVKSPLTFEIGRPDGRATRMLRVAALLGF